MKIVFNVQKDVQFVKLNMNVFTVIPLIINMKDNVLYLVLQYYHIKILYLMYVNQSVHQIHMRKNIPVLKNVI